MSFLTKNSKGFLAGLVIYLAVRFSAEIGSTERFAAVGIGFILIALTSSSFDRVLVLIALLIGFVPMAGWLPGLSNAVDPVALVVAGMTGMSIGRFERINRRHGIDLVAAGASSASVVWLWQMYWRTGPGKSPLSLLLNGWDHVAHFNFFSMSTVHDSFLSRVSHPEGVSEWFTERYPAGIQMFWAQLARVPDDLVTNTDHLLIVYGRVNVINMALSLALCLIAILRVSRSHRPSLVVAITMAVAGFVLLGPLSISLTAGYPNFGITCASLFIAMSIIVRPMPASWMNALILNGMMLVSAYNWFPAAIPLCLPIAGLLLQDLRASSGRGRVALLAISVVGVIGSALPIIQNLGLGTTHLEATGGIPVLLPLYPAIFGLLSVVLSLKNLSRPGIGEAVKCLSIPIVNILLVLGILISNRMNSGGYPYYSQKVLYLGTAVAFAWTLLQLMVLIESQSSVVSVSESPRKRGLITLLFGFVSLQFWGYVGPDYSVLAGANAAPALHTRAILGSGRAFMNHSIAILRAVRDDQQLSLGIERPVLIVDSVPSAAHPILLNYLPGVLNQRFDDAQFQAALKMGGVSMVPFFSFEEFMSSFVAQYVPYEVDIVTTVEFARELLEIDPEWADSVYIYSGDDNLATIKKLSDDLLVG